MSAGGKFSWGITGAATLVIGLALVALVRAPETKPRAGAARPKANVAIESLQGGGANALLEERARLRNPTPLFVPTVWNASQQARGGESRRDPGGVFGDFSARMSHGDTARPILGRMVATPGGAAARLAEARETQPFAGLGRADVAQPALAARGAYLQVTREVDGSQVLAEALEAAKPPEVAPLWQPLEFLAAIDATGLVGTPALLRSSRVAAVDGYFQNYLVQTIRLGERLRPGFYRVAIGP